MNQRFKILFFLKRGKGCKQKQLPIYVRVKVDDTAAEWSVQRRLETGSKWNQKLGRVTGTKEESRTLNSYLDAIQGNIFTIQKECALRNECTSAEEVRAKILGKKGEKRHTLIEVYTYHNEQFKQLVGKEFSNGTYKKFKSALSSLQSFVEWKFSANDVPINTVNHNFITDYEFYLKTVQKVQHNSAMGLIKKLKKIIRQCVANEWLDKDPFRSYKITTKETHRNFLLDSELEVLRTKKISVQRLDQVRDIFLFSCYTGLSYSDVMFLSSDDVSIGIDGEKWIFVRRTKTDTASRIPLLPIAKLIIEKYSNHPQTVTAGTLLPRLSNQRLNSYLKEIGDVCGFKKELTFHCARHTFATTVTLTNGVPIETVGKMLGHKDLRTTQLYAKILDDKVSSDMQQLKKRLSKKEEKMTNTAILSPNRSAV
jgi:site-specific recombinase XerD